MKKIASGIFALVIVFATVPMFAAFESHIINVTAKIENALSVTTNEIAFGTVFPQQRKSRNFSIFMSESFMQTDEVEAVEYVIKEKPKVRVLGSNGKHDPYAIIFPDDDKYHNGVMAHQYCLTDKPADVGNINDLYYTYCYPVLCGQLSTVPADINENNDTGVTAPHDWTEDVSIGKLSKITSDVSDVWNLDLVVAGFAGMVDQAYTTQVYGPYLDPRLEHEIFGCDLWIEITGITEHSDTPPGTVIKTYTNQNFGFKLDYLGNLNEGAGVTEFTKKSGSGNIFFVYYFPTTNIVFVLEDLIANPPPGSLVGNSDVSLNGCTTRKVVYNDGGKLYTYYLLTRGAGSYYLHWDSQTEAGLNDEIAGIVSSFKCL